MAEYEAAQSLFLHYDGFRWQAGSMLIGGAFVFLGFLTGSDADRATYALGSAVVSIVLGSWALFAHHYRQLYMFKVDRIVELEELMGAQQNRRFNPWCLPPGAKTYPRFGPRGHNIDLVVFVTMSLGGPGLALANDQWSLWMIPSLATIATTLAIVILNERRLMAWLGANRTTALSSVEPSDK